MDLLVVAPPESPLKETFLREFKRVSAISRQIVLVDPAKLTTADADRPGVWLAVGDACARQILALKPKSPVIALFLTRQEFLHLPAATDSRDAPRSAIFHNAPLDRQLALGQLLIGHSSRAAVLSSDPDFKLRDESVSRSQVWTGLVNRYLVQNSTDLARALRNALQDNDFILGTLDLQVYNGQQIKQILLTAYRQNKVLIGPSRAYVRAGALASTYSSVVDIARQLVEFLADYERQGRLPEPAYPRYFSIEINEQVARSLNLVIPDMHMIKQQLRVREVR